MGLDVIKLWEAFLSFLKIFGLPGALVVIWWLDHKRFSQFEELLMQYRTLTENYMKIAEDYRETVFVNIQQLSRMEQKIDTNTFCPIIRKESRR